MRVPMLRGKAELVEPLADKIATLDGVEQVQIRPFTGSVLCTFDPWKVTTENILFAIKEQFGELQVIRPGEHSEFENQALVEEAIDQGSGMARALAGMVKGMNLEMLRATGGTIDLGTLATAGFMVAGAAEIVRTGKIPMPPWFNLGWWAFRTFSTLEKTAIQQTEAWNPEPEAASEEGREVH